MSRININSSSGRRMPPLHLVSTAAAAPAPLRTAANFPPLPTNIPLPPSFMAGGAHQHVNRQDAERFLSARQLLQQEEAKKQEDLRREQSRWREQQEQQRVGREQPQQRRNTLTNQLNQHTTQSEHLENATRADVAAALSSIAHSPPPRPRSTSSTASTSSDVAMADNQATTARTTLAEARRRREQQRSSTPPTRSHSNESMEERDRAVASNLATIESMTKGNPEAAAASSSSATKGKSFKTDRK